MRKSEANANLPAEPKTQRGRRTLKALLQAAELVFAERGFHDASIADITHAAGVGAGTLYLYFPDKDVLFRAVVDGLQKELRNHLRDSIPCGGTRLERENQGLRSFLNFSRMRPRLFRILQESYLVDPEIYFTYFGSIARSYAARLADAQAAGEIAQGDPTVQAWCLIGLSNFLGLRYSLPDAVDIDVDTVMKTAGPLIERALAPSVQPFVSAAKIGRRSALPKSDNPQGKRSRQDAPSRGAKAVVKKTSITRKRPSKR